MLHAGFEAGLQSDSSAFGPPADRPSLPANRSRECAPDDRLGEAIQSKSELLDCFVVALLAMTAANEGIDRCLKKACWRESGYWSPAAAPGSGLRWGAAS